MLLMYFMNIYTKITYTYTDEENCNTSLTLLLKWSVFYFVRDHNVYNLFDLL